MAFESLTEKLQNVFKNLRSKGKLTEADVKTALRCKGFPEGSKDGSSGGGCEL